MTDEKPRPPRRRRPRQPLSPLTRSLNSPLLPHAAVLEELLSPTGGLLWQFLQDTTLWSTADRSAREGLFADVARATEGVVPEVEEELDALAVLVRDPHPDAGPLIARMCDRVRMWAEGKGVYATALAFAQAAALSDPENARCAYQVGRLSRQRAEFARAEVWYQRAAVLATRSSDAETRALSLSGLANLHGQRGNYAAALRLNERAVRLAHRHSLREVLGTSYHGLAVLQFETGAVQEGMRSIRRAVRALGVHHGLIPFIVHDAAVALMDQLGEFAAAGEVFQALLPHFTRPGERLLVLANFARAAGATGQKQVFEALWTDTWPVLRGSAECVATDSLVALARGAVSLGEWTCAREAAERALSLAQERGEGKTIFLAEAVLGACESERQHSVRTAHPQSAPSCEETAGAAMLARDCIQTLGMRPRAPDPVLEKFCAVLSQPSDPGGAYELGRVLRIAGEYERAQAWLEYAITAARAAGDRPTEALCLAGMGNLHVARGDLPLGLDFHRRRLDLARVAGLRELEGDAMVDLCAVSFGLDQAEAGFAFAQGALDVLGPEHRLIPRLAHDLAVYLMESRGDFENALLLFQALQAREFAPADRLLLDASLSRAAAGAGSARLFEDTWAAVWQQVADLPDSDCPAGVLIQLAHGAMVRGHYDAAGQAAARALAITIARKESHEEAVARTLVEAAGSAARTRARAAVQRAAGHDARSASRLARGFAAALRSGATRSFGVARTSKDLQPRT